MGKRIEHQPGEKRGRLTFVAEIEPVQQPSGQTPRRGRFRCDCGNEIETLLRSWRDGTSTSCGCFKAEVASARLFRHGLAARQGERDKLYLAWTSMRARCGIALQAKLPTYRGVSCDPRWETFEGFSDNRPAGRPFEPGLVLSRLGDVGDYTPDNTRWTTKAENGREAGEQQMLQLPNGRFALDVARENGITDSAYHHRIQRGWAVERAITEAMRP